MKKILLIIAVAAAAALPASAQQSGAAETVKTPVDFSIEMQKPPAMLGSGPYRFRLRIYAGGDYTEEIIIFGGLSAEHRMDASEGWDRAFVELLDTGKIDGRYSPGPNPCWYENDGSGRIVRNIDFQSQENPIPDGRQAELAAAFAPIILMDRDKKYKPSNFEKFIDGYTIDKYESGSFMILDEAMETGGDTHIYYHVRYADTWVSGMNSPDPGKWRDNRNYRYSEGDGSIVISYWIWYDRNEGPTSFGNVHQGDLESCAVLVDADGRPLRFMTTGHDHIMLDTAWTNINSVGGHPLIYIAGGNRGADGGNPTSAYGGYRVDMDAGNPLFTFLTRPADIFPDPAAETTGAIIPSDLSAKDLRRVLIGPGMHIDSTASSYVDLSGRIIGTIAKLVKWEEPGWINLPADTDPDGHHRVDPAAAPFLAFDGRIGMHPESRLVLKKLKQFGASPENAPFKTNVEQHYTYEKPQSDRSHSTPGGSYGPKFEGDALTPQLLN